MDEPSAAIVLEVRTLEPVPAGTELTISYLDGATACSPTRAALLTGRYGSRTGINTALVDSARGGLPLDEVLLPQLLRKAGYSTYAVGKWHLISERFRIAAVWIGRGIDVLFYPKPCS